MSLRITETKKLSKITLALGAGIVISAAFMLQVRAWLFNLLGNLLVVNCFRLCFILIFILAVAFAFKRHLNLFKIFIIAILFVLGYLFSMWQPYFSEKTHVLTYGLLGYLAMNDLSQGKTIAQFKDMATAVFFVSSISALDEIFQGILPYRYGEIRDFITNIISGILGIGIYFLFNGGSAKMRKNILMAFLLIFSLVCIIQEAVAGASPQQPIELTIKSDEQMYKKGRAIGITVQVKNTAKYKVSFLTMPMFELSSNIKKNMIIASNSVKLDKEPVYSKRFGEMHPLELAPFEEKTFEYNLSIMKWGSVFSSEERRHLFREVITPGGQYTVRFIIKFSGKERMPIISNPIIIKIVE